MHQSARPTQAGAPWGDPGAATLECEPRAAVGSRVLHLAMVDRHEVVRLGLAALLARDDAPIRLVESVPTARGLTGALPVDVVLFDAVAPPGSSVAGEIAVLRRTGAAVVLYVAEVDAGTLREATHAGAVGVIPFSSSAAATVAAILAVAGLRASGAPAGVHPAASTGRGGSVHGPVAAPVDGLVEHLGDCPVDGTEPQLSAREREALALYAAGLPLKSVARRMAVSDYTAKEYLKRVRRKYADAGRPANTKLELYRRAVEDGVARAVTSRPVLGIVSNPPGPTPAARRPALQVVRQLVGPTSSRFAR